MLVSSQKRPRVLSWYHAGPLLFGDWGTSRLYVLGIAFFYTAHASPIYLGAMSIVMAAVAWAYVVICRCFPEGGGVYTAARQLSPWASLVGATLLLAGYVITAAISVVVALRYFGLAHAAPGWAVFGLAAAIILALGAVNWLGARSAGRFALLVALAALLVSLVLAVACVPRFADGLRSVRLEAQRPTWERWSSFVAIVLALSGIESVANMTGLMRTPVARTARRTIWPVLAEVVLLNMLFGIAFQTLPQVAGVVAPDALAYTGEGVVPESVREYRDTAMRLLATETTGRVFGGVAAFVFGLLLLSAANTAVIAMISVLYAMAQDGELPRPLTRLNYSGVPWVALVISLALPTAVLALERDVDALAKLYAIGVCGAVTTNVLSCVLNRALSLTPLERAAMTLVGLVMGAVTVTIVATELAATAFAGALIGAVVAIRQGLAYQRAAGPAPLPVPVAGWLAEVERAPAEMALGKPRIMLAARGRYQAEFAVDLARRRGAILFALYVRTLRVIDIAPGTVPRVQDDPVALEALGTAAVLAHKYRVPFVPIYVASPDIAEEILDYTVTFGCDTLILGKSGRSLFARRIAGDVIAQVAQHLPSEVALITRDPTPHPLGPPPDETVIGPATANNSEAPPT